jgi:hypothetical protein
MSTSRIELPDEVVALDRLIELAHSRGYGESVQFLRMARTQLLIEINGITDAEFRAFCDWIEGRAPPREKKRRAGAGRLRRNGQLRGMRRAWLCPEDATALRRSLRRAARTSR